MALFEDLAGAELLGVNVVAGLAVGAAALFVAPLAAPMLRPVAKAAIKGGLYAYQSAAELYEQASSAISEFATEAQQELTRDSADSEIAAGRPGSSPKVGGR